MEEFITHSENETLEVAAKFATTLSAGNIILLNGDLGAGKTVFTKGIVNALSNGKIIAVSPTFVIVNTYDTQPAINHFDLYRIEDVSELEAIGIEEYLYSDAINIVEWSERAIELFPNDSIVVEILKVDDNTRKIRIDR
ncbi:MAG: tRNA (adenosine(37)-N6)-threonylcarbamoyltransferase complex ATPase subunit type 1 TsaE [Clostridia bacterium]|nr:tRNA (adenosine(37)-N6)-threonylcarbamoyltransferase complex ATPase subunit type 1 TsaE [Clostridia bacterium]